MRALVTGGTGMLGSRIARLLYAEGADVRITYRPGDTLRAVEGLSVEHCPADLLDDRALRRVLAGIDVVFHNAALVSFKPSLQARQWATNVEGTARLLAAMADASVRRMIHTSTVNTLGVPPEGSYGDEETPFDWGRYRLGYMDSKRAAERLVLDAARGGDLFAACILPGTLFGPGDVNCNAGTYIRVVARAPIRLAPPGGTTVAHVDDVARGAVLALERGRSAERYILGGEPMLYRDLMEVISREIGLRRPGFVLPAAPLRALGRLGSRLRDAGLVVPLSEGQTRAICSRLFYSSAKAVSELGWSFRPAVEAIRDGVRWYRGEEML